MKTSQFHSARVSIALAALWLAACGGGGGGSDATVAPGAAPAPVATGPAAPTPSPAPATAPTPAPAAPATVVAGDTQLTVNTTYNVSTPAAGTVTLTLPGAAAANDTLGISGTSATPWVIAQNAGQSIVTTGLGGNVPPGTTWTPRLTPKVWHWLSTDATGQVLLAGEAAGGVLDTSVDGGQTWTSGDSPAGIWISSDMSVTGNRMVAVQYQGGMYTSSDFGAHSVQVTAPLVNTTAGVLSFEGVTMSQDGQRLAAVIQPSVRDALNPTSAALPNGRLVISNDGGATWTEPALPGGSTVQHYWRNIDSSADGSVLVAVAQGGEIFLSTDAGATWSVMQVALTSAGTTTAVSETWYRVKLSADGRTIALVANTYGGAPGSGIYVSRDRGTTWTRGLVATADYTELAVSADGTRIAATSSNISSTTTGAITTPGRVVLSTDAGATFNPLTMPGTDTDWRAIAMSADGNKMAAATGKFDALPTAHAGQLYTSLGNRTSVGTGGSITGGQNASVSLRFVGNGQWAVQSSTGGPFVIR